MRKITGYESISIRAMEALEGGQSISNEFFTVELRTNKKYYVYYNGNLDKTFIGLADNTFACSTIINAFVWGCFMSKHDDIEYNG